MAQTFPNEKRSILFGRFWPIWVVICVLLILRLGMINIPLTRDEGSYAYIATRLLVGDVPYRDQWDHKPPGVYFTYATAFRLLGSSAASLHILAALVECVGLFLLFLIARRIYGPVASFATSVVYALAVITQDGPGINTEIFVAVCSIAGFYFFLRFTDNGQWWWALLTGLAFGLGFMYKQVALPDLAALWLFWLWMRWRQWSLPYPLWHVMRAMVVMTVGFLVALVPFIAYFMRHNALDELYRDAFVYNSYYVGVTKFSRFVTAVFNTIHFGQNHLLLGSSAVVASIEVLRTNEAPERRLPLFWLAGSLLGVCLSPYFFGHYYIQLLAPLALLAGKFLGDLLHGIMSNDRGQWRQPLTLFVLVIIGWSGIHYATSYLAYFRGSSYLRERELRETVAYLKEESAEDDLIFIWGVEPQVYFESGRRSASKFISVYPFIRPIDLYPDSQAQLVKDLTEQRVELILVEHGLDLDVPPFMQSILDSNYRFESEVGGLKIYRLVQ